MFPFTSSRRGQPRTSTSVPRPVPGTSQSSTPPIPLDEASSEDGVPRSEKHTALARMKTWVADSLGMLQTAMSIAADMAGDSGVPALSMGLASLAEVLEKLEMMQTTVEGVETLKKRVTSLLTSLEGLRRQCDNKKLPDGMRLRIEELVKLWEDVRNCAAEIKSRGKVARFFTSDKDARRLGSLVEKINDSIQDKIVTKGILNVETYVYEIHQDVKEIKQQLHGTFMPRYAQMAPYHSNDVRRSCLEGTRVDFLQDIYSRITSVCNRGETTPDEGIVLWINGLGGTGKTTVARSVAEWCDDPQRRILGGSFFCSRSDNDCSDPNLVFPTLCRQLCEHHRPFKDEVEGVLERNPDIANHGLYRQFEELIVRPLESLESPFPRSVFVLDALDELKKKGHDSSKSTILSVVAKFVPRIARFLLLVITSRPEEDITTLFEAKRQGSLKETTTPLLMHNIPLKTALEDIMIYMDSEFEANIAHILPGWPSAEEKSALARQSQGLFIYITTAIKFIMGYKMHGNPKARLDLLLKVRPTSSTPQEFLSALYSTIMVATQEEATQELVDSIRNVLGTVVLLQEPLSPSAIACLLGVEEQYVRIALMRLHSVLHVPSIGPDSNQPIRIIHPTFPEFLLSSPDAITFESSQTHSSPTTLRLQPTQQHWHLFTRSIQVMSTILKRDMIGIQYPAAFQSEVEDLEQRVRDTIGPYLSYACRFWGFHFRDGVGAAAPLDTDIVQAFRSFVHEQLLYWLETCSLLDAMDRVTFALDAALTACRELGGPFEGLMSLLTDCRRFVLEYSPCIHAAPLQLYHFALSIAPTASNVATSYANERTHAIVVEDGAPTNWAPCFDVLRGHGGLPVEAAAFATDGSCFVTGGADHRATVWKTATRTPVVSFEGHHNSVRDVAFSPDGVHVVSGSQDRRVCVWQASSGDCVRVLEGHTDMVFSVAYSEDGRRILSATARGEVRLWDPSNGSCLFSLDKTGDIAWQVGLAPNGDVIARGDEASVCLYNVSVTNEAQALWTASQVLEFPAADRVPVQACTFSPDGHYIAARSERIIHVWARTDGSLVRSIHVPEGLFGRLAFSRDGALIGCGSKDGSVRLWTVSSSNDPPRVLQGHTHWVSDLACSPDRSQVISASLDGTIRVWDGTHSSIPISELTTLDRLPSTPGAPCFALIQLGSNSIALLFLPALGIDSERFALRERMPIGTPTATLFPNVVSAWDIALQCVDQWDGHAGACAWTPFIGRNHTRLSQRPFAISLDGSLIAYPSPTSDKAVDVCNLYAGTVVARLVGHTDEIHSIAFSPDHARLVTGSGDKSVKVWDTSTGALICGHTKHRSSIRTTAFSPDGRLVASGSGDETVCIFDVVTQLIVRVLDSHQQPVAHMMFTSDNNHLVTLDHASWLCVWDVTTGVSVRKLSLQDHRHLSSPLFSPDDTGILVYDDDGVARTISVWEPGTRTWPAYHVTEDGWLYAMSPGKVQRLCLLPTGWRTTLHSDGDMLYVGEAKSVLETRRRVIVLNMSQIQDHIDTLDASP